MFSQSEHKIILIYWLHQFYECFQSGCRLRYWMSRRLRLWLKGGRVGETWRNPTVPSSALTRIGLVALLSRSRLPAFIVAQTFDHVPLYSVRPLTFNSLVPVPFLWLSACLSMLLACSLPARLSTFQILHFKLFLSLHGSIIRCRVHLLVAAPSSLIRSLVCIVQSG